MAQGSAMEGRESITYTGGRCAGWSTLALSGEPPHLLRAPHKDAPKCIANRYDILFDNRFTMSIMFH